MPACPTPVYGEYGFQNYSPGFYASPGDTPFGGDSSGFDTTSVVAADSGPASLAANGMHDPTPTGGTSTTTAILLRHSGHRVERVVGN